MHRKSIEAAAHLKDDAGTNSDHEETTSLRTDTSDTSVTSGTTGGQQPAQAQGNVNVNVNGSHTAPTGDNSGQAPPQTVPPSQSDKDQPQQQQTSAAAAAHHQQHYQDDPEAFRNNSIACLRAKAQEHNAKLLNHGLMLQVRSLANMTHAHAQPPNCDANANNLNLHHPDIVSSDTSSSMFWHQAEHNNQSEHWLSN